MKDQQDLRVGLYARVSGEQQAREDTVASQLQALQQRIAADGSTCLPKLQFIDEGYSGSTLVRPALERLRDAAAAGELDRLYVLCPDRLARRYAYQVLLVEELRRYDVDLVFLNRPIGVSPEEDLLLQVQGMVAEYERAKILERCRRGKRHAALHGEVNVLGGAPYGYRYITKNEGHGQASYQVILEQARVVRQIFEWVGQERISIAEVRRRLAQQGTPSPKGRPYWERPSIWGLLKNPAYKGTAAFGKTQVGPRRPRLRAYRGQAEQPRHAESTYDTPSQDWLYVPVPAIISEELFGVVSEQLAENRIRSRQSRRGARYLLQGLLVCGQCGHAFYGKPVSLATCNGKRPPYVYYRCIGMDAFRFGGQRICENRQVRSDQLEATVWRDVCELLREPERIEREYQRRLDGEQPEEDTHNHQALEAMIRRVQRGISRLIDAYQDGLLERTEFEPRLAQTRDRLSQLQAEAKAQADRQTEVEQLRTVIGHLRDFSDRIKQGLEDADWTTRRQIIRALVKRVEIDTEMVRVVYRVNPPSRPEGPVTDVLHHCCRRGLPAARDAP
jgi:site-specific DNA recombinase